jgi:hypothetical protein
VKAAGYLVSASHSTGVLRLNAHAEAQRLAIKIDPTAPPLSGGDPYGDRHNRQEFRPLLAVAR